MKFLFTCGGTAGHINPAIAVAGRIKELMPDAEFLFVGASGNMELELVPREGYPIREIQVNSLERRLTWDNVKFNIRSARDLVRSQGQARKILEEFRPHVAVGTGGYVCYPVLHQAAKLGIPTVVHESNAVPGLTTKMLSGQVNKVLVGFNESRAFYRHPEKVEVTGNPIRGDFMKWDKRMARKSLGVGAEPLVVSFWGSLGASGMNRVTAGVIAINEKTGNFRMIHATGSGLEGVEKMRTALKENGTDLNELKYADVRPYIYDMPCVMAAADLIICRAGASTLGELAAIGKPAILVPSPYVTNNHQEKNAKVPADRGGAVMLREADATAERLFETARDLVSDTQKMQHMSAAMSGITPSDATDKITSIVLELAAGN